MTTTTSAIAIPLTLSSAYFGGTKTTRSTNPQALRKLVNDLRRGDGDTILITDADGVCYDLTDAGNGLQLVAIPGSGN